MNEREGDFDNLTAAEFEEMMTNAMSPDFHDLAEEDFFTALAAIDEESADTSMLRHSDDKRGSIAIQIEMASGE